MALIAPKRGKTLVQGRNKQPQTFCFNKEVRIEETEVDRYGRTLGVVCVGNVCENKELLKQGMAWHYKYFNKDPELAKLETEALKAKVGIWSQSYPVMKQPNVKCNKPFNQ